MATTPSGPTLTCSQCGFANETERVYCHNCGAKLDRSLLPRAEEAGRDSVEKVRKRVRKMTNPGQTSTTRELKTLANVIVYAVLAAFIIGFIRAPEGVPADKAGEGGLRMVGSEIAEALDSPQARALQFAEGEVNNYFRSALKSKTGGLLPGVKFERAYVKFEPGNVYIGLQQSVAGYPLYSGARYQIGVKDGKFFARNFGGNFGRIAMHPELMRHLGIAFQPLWKALKREKDQVESMQRVEAMKGSIILVTKGRGQ
jgi:hypothetical protein